MPGRGRQHQLVIHQADHGHFGSKMVGQPFHVGTHPIDELELLDEIGITGCE